MLKDILQDEGDFTFMSQKFINRQQGRKCLRDNFDGKAVNLSAMEYVKNGRQGDYVKCGSMIGRKINPDTGGHQSRGLASDGIKYRKLTPIECERLQTVPDNYTNHVSNTQRYKMLGNGWTVDVISHIFKPLLTIDFAQLESAILAMSIPFAPTNEFK